MGAVGKNIPKTTQEKNCIVLRKTVEKKKPLSHQSHKLKLYTSPTNDLNPDSHILCGFNVIVVSFLTWKGFALIWFLNMGVDQYFKIRLQDRLVALK